MNHSRLYEADETAWLEQMSQLIRDRKYDRLDYEHLSEYLQDMAQRDRREVMSRLTVLLAQMLKWRHQPTLQSKSWELMIEIQRDQLRELLESQTLKDHAAEVLPRAYVRASKYASADTGLAEETFPQDCPFTCDEVLGSE